MANKRKESILFDFKIHFYSRLMRKINGHISAYSEPNSPSILPIIKQIKGLDKSEHYQMLQCTSKVSSQTIQFARMPSTLLYFLLLFIAWQSLSRMINKMPAWV